MNYLLLFADLNAMTTTFVTISTCDILLSTDDMLGRT